MKAAAIILSAESLPPEGALVMYAGLAWYGEDFGDHGPLGGCRLRVAEHTPLGFFVTVEDERLHAGNGDEAFIAIEDEMLGRYFLLSEAVAA